jgi:hypothetical protein
MIEAPAAGTTATAGELQIGDRVTWLAGWNYGEPFKIVKVRDSDDLPGYVEMTEAPEVVHSRQLQARRLRKDGLVARVIAKTCDPGARIWSLTGKVGLLMRAYLPRLADACEVTMPCGH